MKKIFTDPTKTQKKKPRTSLGIMTTEMREVYNDFYGDKEYLENEWNYCMLNYERAIKQSLVTGVTFNARMSIRKIATYWLNRKNALEKILDSDTIQQYKSNRE